MQVVARRTAARVVLFALTLALLSPVPLPAADAGAVVAHFKANDLEGQPLALGELLATRRVAVFFWDWRRATSARAMQVLDRLQGLHAKRGFEVVAVEGEGTAVEKVLERVAQLRAIGNLQRYRIVPDPGGRIARQYRVESTPQIFLLDGAGRVAFHLEGFRAEDEALLEQRVKEQLGLAAPPPATPSAAAATAARAPAAAPAPPRPVSVVDPEGELLERYRYFGNYHLNRGEPAQAEEYFRKIVALRPAAVAAWLSIGEACARQRRYDEARHAWEQALRHDPGNPEADANIRRLIRGEY